MTGTSFCCGKTPQGLPTQGNYSRSRLHLCGSCPDLKSTSVRVTLSSISNCNREVAPEQLHILPKVRNPGTKLCHEGGRGDVGTNCFRTAMGTWSWSSPKAGALGSALSPSSSHSPPLPLTINWRLMCFSSPASLFRRTSVYVPACCSDTSLICIED